MCTIYYQYIRFAFVKISFGWFHLRFRAGKYLHRAYTGFSTVAIELKKTMRMYVRMIYSCNHLYALYKYR